MEVTLLLTKTLLADKFHPFASFQLIAAYSTPPAPPAPPEAPDYSYDSASARLDFKDSDMKRLSMEIERER